MNKKIFIFIILAFFISGCDMSYKLEMKKGNFEENFSFIGTKEEYTTKGSTKEGKEEIVDFLYQVEENDPSINKKTLYEYNNIVYKYNRSFPITEIEFWPSFSNLCLETVQALYNDEGEMIIRSSSPEPCYAKYKELKNIFITFQTDYKVLETNGKKEKEGYTWHFKRGEENKDIYIKLEAPKEEQKIKKEKKNIPIFPILFWICIIALIIGSIYFIRKKIQGNNKFD